MNVSVSFEPVKYAACALPKGHAAYADYVLRVVLRPRHGQWAIFHAGAPDGGQYLNADGSWGAGGNLFDLDAARRLAMDAALTIMVRGRTAADVIGADRAAAVR